MTNHIPVIALCMLLLAVFADCKMWASLAENWAAMAVALIPFFVYTLHVMGAI